MKPIKLTLRGINSYRKEQVIDFSELTSYGLFGIFGPTGSGKSSILDAITLALYARLPRSTKNFININEETAFISFVFSITTTSARRYQADRSFRYHGKEGAATVRNISGRLLDITDEAPIVLADRPTDMTKECIRLLGLESDDFMRTVVLPQGQFSEFLKLKNADRRSMLQRIFHLEKYGLEMTQKIAAARQENALRLSKLEGELGYYADITPQKLKETRQELQDSLAMRKSALPLKAKAEADFQEAGELLSLWEEYEPLLARSGELKERLPHIRAQKERLETGKRANLIRPFAAQAEEADREHKNARKDLAVKSKALEQSSRLLEALQEGKEQADAACGRELPLLASQEQKLNTALDIAAVISKWDGKRKQLLSVLHKQKPAMDRLERQKQLLTEQEASIKQAIGSLEENISALQTDPGRRSALEQGHIMEKTYRERRKDYDQKKAGLSTEKENLRQIEIKVNAVMASLDSHGPEGHYTAGHGGLAPALSWIGQQKERLEHQMETLQRERMAELLREDLREGQPCPVCGSVHHSTADFSLAESGSLSLEQNEIRRQKKLLEDAEKNLRTEQGRAEQLWQHFGTYQEQLAEEFEELQKSAQNILRLRQAHGIENFTEELNLLRKNEKEQQKLTDALREQRKSLEDLRNRQEKVSSEILELSGKIAATESEIKNYESFIREQWEKFPEGVDKNADLPAALKQVLTDKASLEQKLQQSEQKLQEAAENNQKIREQALAAGSIERQAGLHAAQTEEIFLTQLTKMGFSENEDPASFYLTDRQIKDFEEEIGQYQDSLQKTGERLHYLKEKLRGRSITREEWQSKKDYYEEQTQNLEKLQRQITLLEKQEEHIFSCLEKKKSLEEDLAALSHKKGLIRQLEQLFKGNAFIEYVAESRLRYIAVEASDILSSISGGDYALEINDHSEFVIRDNKNGGVLRPCDTLSGGETFVTSLALALSLSSAIQLNGTAPLELFFLDEGFGSLDEDLLDVVMTSLERLKNKRRSIGIITHVEAIRSRVPVKLLVSPSGAGQDGSVIRMEYT